MSEGIEIQKVFQGIHLVRTENVSTTGYFGDDDDPEKKPDGPQAERAMKRCRELSQRGSAFSARTKILLDMFYNITGDSPEEEKRRVFVEQSVALIIEAGLDLDDSKIEFFTLLLDVARVYVAVVSDPTEADRKKARLIADMQSLLASEEVRGEAAG